MSSGYDDSRMQSIYEQPHPIETVEKGKYYWVGFYNHKRKIPMLYNGERFEAFHSENVPHDEINFNTIEEL
ncbi:MAG: hypothetical protein R3232_07085 [Clostridia bacterium]|nr:hypothetical protein [Clostridia bacterium]